MIFHLLSIDYINFKTCNQLEYYSLQSSIKVLGKGYEDQMSEMWYRNRRAL